jgi:phosphoglycolate phosphatase-like HAD superfamily hydrolase
MSLNFEQLAFVGMDMDGTTFCRRALKRKAFLETFNAIFGSVHNLNEDEFTLVEDMKSKVAIPELFRILELKEPDNFSSLIEAFVVERRRYEDRNLNLFTLAEGVQDFLETLKSNKVMIGLATNNDLRHIREILDYHKLTGYFDAFSGDSKDGRFVPKPHPYSLIEMQNQLIDRVKDYRIILERRSAYLGDNIRDGEAVRGLNLVRKDQGYKSNMEYVGVDLRDPHRKNAAEAIKRLGTRYYTGNFTHILNSGFALTPFL